MSTTASKFCTVEDVRGLLRTESGWSADDGLAESQIKVATALIRQYTRREWELDVYVDYFNSYDIDAAIRKGQSYASFTLREKNVSVADGLYPAMKYSVTGKWDNAQTVNKDHYSVDTRLNRIIMYPQYMQSWGRSVRVSYTAGYPIDETDTDLVLVPQNLRMAAARQSAFMVRSELNNVMGSSREGSASRSPSAEITRVGLIRDVLALVQPEVRLFTGNA